jgi:NADH-quinone oxidoreductase subunit L
LPLVIEQFVVLFIGWKVLVFVHLLNCFWHKNQDFNDAAKKSIYHEQELAIWVLLIGIFIIGSLFSTLDCFKNWLSHGATDLDHTSGSLLPPPYLLVPGQIHTNSIVYLAARCDGRSSPVSALLHAATMVTTGVSLYDHEIKLSI